MNFKMTRIRIIPYKNYSKSAKSLAKELGGKRLRLLNSKFIPKSDDLIINWGNKSLASLATLNNSSEKLKTVANKKLFFESMEEEDFLPKYWTKKEDIPDEYPIVCRTVLCGHSGEGIAIANTPDELVDADLYVKYMKKKEEYRVHVGSSTSSDWSDCSVISIQQKKRKLDCENPDWKVRNHANGFIYARNEIDPPDSVINAAKRCLHLSGLDFGAVDVIWNEQKEKAYVLEINTAPGLEGTTVKDYAEYFKSYAE